MIQYDEYVVRYREQAFRRYEECLRSQLTMGIEHYIDFLKDITRINGHIIEALEKNEPIPTEWVSASAYPLNVWIEQPIIEHLGDTYDGHWFIKVLALASILGPLSCRLIYEIAESAEKNPHTEKSHNIRRCFERRKLLWIFEESTSSS
jgi:hypothetical protein